MLDAVILGAGPSGLAAAIYLAKAGRSVLVLGKKNKIWNTNVIINNYFATGVTNGAEIMEKGYNQAKSFGAEIVDDLATNVEFTDRFIIHTGNNSFESRMLLVATGNTPKNSNIKGEEKFTGRGVSYCATCDGFFFKNKKVLIIGSGDFAARTALQLLVFTKDLTIITNGEELKISNDLVSKTKKAGIKVEDLKIDEIIGGDKVTGVKSGKRVIKTDGVFIALGDASSTDFAKSLGMALTGNKIKVDSEMKTNVPKVWAAGDCTPNSYQISTAVGSGVLAATSMIKDSD
ncbi:Ferredoxin--NADP reductase [Candidatus Tiddalikarchaeum anstoanum]|nr:Ferredoxin--NADP reductase [Candidatus Tiddalikarchaeum anstoanum]